MYDSKRVTMLCIARVLVRLMPLGAFSMAML